MSSYRITANIPSPEILLAILAFFRENKVAGVVVDPVREDPEVKMVKFKGVLNWEALKKALTTRERFVLHTLWGHKEGISTDQLAAFASQPTHSLGIGRRDPHEWVRQAFESITGVAHEHKYSPNALFILDSGVWRPGQTLLAHTQIPLAPETTPEAIQEQWEAFEKSLTVNERFVLRLLQLPEHREGISTHEIAELSTKPPPWVDNVFMALQGSIHPYGFDPSDIFMGRAGEKGFFYIPGRALLAHPILSLGPLVD